jgi:DNA-directed RNA polymerase specialized sigma24 family protein
MISTAMISTARVRMYAVSAEFQKVFKENMDGMYLLSFLLTTDHAKAEECFVSGLEDCAEGSHVFREWARSWAQRTMIRNAIRIVEPRRKDSTAEPRAGSGTHCVFARTQHADLAITSILALEDFERFVFVMSVLERYPDQDCSVLLDCSRQDVRETKARALQHVAESNRLRILGEAEVESNDGVGQQTRESQLVPRFWRPSS